MPDTLDYSRLFESKVIDDSAEDDIFAISSGTIRNLIIMLSNQTASPVTVDGWVIPSGGSSGAGNKFLEDYSIGANTFEEIPVPKMVAGDKLTLRAGTASALTVFDNDSVRRV
jgi:hypothetical protein